MNYPPNWPRCPSCGDFALDGHITCGRAECDESANRDREAAYWRDQWRIAPLSERDPEGYEQQMHDAGRGHLLKP